ncbi:exopolysaccharide biosynthesis protein [Dongia deserti]|uniref:exopolysaccharide biosynthesis protein n=1 Tax=Dongia deserti TaxID=2268030 RepID=UPI000E6577CA|nr:exopolysaccharide biosynthesis protein [Dongia deserti]
MEPHVPTSVALEELVKEAPPDHVTLAWLTSSLQERSFGLVMLIMALAALVPGAAIFIGILLGFLAAQMILGRDSPGLPRFITSRRVPTRQVVRLVHRTIPLLKRMEKIIHPRWRTPFETTKRIVGLVVLLLAVTLFSPFPFSHIIPALVIMLISFAYLEEDGALLCISLGTALVSLAITSATVWATIRATDVLERLLT